MYLDRGTAFDGEGVLEQASVREDLPHSADGDLRERLIEAAIELLGTYSYRDVSIQSIVDKVGVTKGSFYYYFPDKESLLFLIHDEFISYELRMAQAAYRNLREPREKLVRFVHDLLESIAKYKPHVTIFFRDRSYLSKENMQKIKAKRDQYEAILIQILEDGKAEGVFRFGNSRVTARAIFGMCNWVYQWFRESGELSIHQIAEEFVRIILQGIEGTEAPSGQLNPRATAGSQTPGVAPEDGF
ncbi:MAG: TetR/AcrR family transcriptional regulator [Alicyclobacillus sp.]|nr:TetR/AcrR family transcriptional regulator [Alicyclobacillus sp.]